MDARELFKEIITDLGTHTRKARMGLPLLRSNEKKKENHAERAQRELREDQLAEASYDHVYWFQQRSAHYDMQVKESVDQMQSTKTNWMNLRGKSLVLKMMSRRSRSRTATWKGNQDPEGK
jgi:hypothetical protein